MRWPSGWKDPSALDLLKGTAIDYLIVADAADLAAVRKRALADGIAASAAPPPGVELVTGTWPGVQMGRGAAASAGPTGIPWVDSNGWAVRLAQALHPEAAVWVDAPPAAGARLTADTYRLAIADSAAYGGRWIVSLDDSLAKSLAARDSTALATWKKLAAATGFFAAHSNWLAYTPLAVIGVISGFAGANQFFSQEVLNLMGRVGAHYRVLPKGAVAEASFESLRAVSYTDAEPPSDALRKQVLAFVASGGMLIAGPAWGAVPSAPAKAGSLPNFSMRSLGKGTIALADSAPDDPFEWANDSVLLVSHRYDLVRFWNSGATGSFCAISPDRKRSVVHLLFYTGRGPDSVAVRIAGRYRAVRASTIDQPELPAVGSEQAADSIEVRLPPVSQYVALDLEVG
jgi:hypothetical protein